MGNKHPEFKVNPPEPELSLPEVPEFGQPWHHGTVKIQPGHSPIKSMSSIRRMKIVSSKSLSEIDQNILMLKSTENLEIIDDDITPETAQWIEQILSKHYLFSQFSLLQRNTIVDNMKCCLLRAGTYLYAEGTEPSGFYLVEQGFLLAQMNGVAKKDYHRGDSFGELGIIYNRKRTLSVKAEEESKVWFISGAKLKRCIEETINANFNKNMVYLQKASFLKSLNTRQKSSIAHNLLPLEYKKGVRIYQKGDPAYILYFLTQGEVEVGEKTIAAGHTFGKESVFGEGERRTESAIAKSDVKCLSCNMTVVKQILGDKLDSIIYYNMFKELLQTCSEFKENCLTEVDLDNLLVNSIIRKMKPGDLMFKKGDVSQQFYLCLPASKTLKKDHQAGFILGHEYFPNHIVGQDVKLPDLGVPEIMCCAILCSELSQILMQRNKQKYFKRLSLQLKVQHLTLQDLRCRHLLGKGQYGQVFLVTSPENRTFALKIIGKAKIQEQHLQLSVKEERKVMEIVNFPFITRCFKTFKDQTFLYLLEEYVEGLELFEVLRKVSIFNKEMVRFYMAQLVLCCEYFHSHNIVYRDFKPENVIIDTQGYTHLVDMGTAKILDQSFGFRTFTMIGTPHYMAPEIINGKGYTTYVDLWSIGVMFFELISGRLPFAEDLDDPYEIYQVIISKPLEIPYFYKDPEGRDFMRQLLNKIPEARLGKNYAHLKQHKFFEKIKWLNLLHKTERSPLMSRFRFTVPPTKYTMDIPMTDVIKQLKEEESTKHSQIPYSIEDWDTDF